MTKEKNLFFCILIILFTSSLSALDFTTTFNIGNLGFSNDMNQSSQGVIWGSSILLRQDLNDIFQFSGGLILDDVSGNRIEGRIIHKSKYFFIGLGPSVASFNNSQIQLKPGMNGIVTVKKDGLFKFTAEVYSTIGNLADRENDYSQLETSLQLALNIPGAICTFIIDNRQFSRFNIDTSSIISKTTDFYSLYAMETDLHKKNIPFHLLITLGYKSFKRIFPANDISGRTMAGIGSLYIGAGTRVNIGRKMILTALIDSGLYNFTLSEELAQTDLPGYLFNMNMSFTYRF